MIAEPSNYNNAYFELRSIKAYTGAPTTRSITMATQVNSTTTSTNNSGSGSNANAPSSGGTGAGSRNGVNVMASWAIAGAVVVAFAL